MDHCATLESVMTLQARRTCMLLFLLAGCATVPKEPPAPSPPALAPAAAPETAAAKPPAKAPPPAARATPPPKAAIAGPAALKPKAPPLDLASLEKRLKETDAIGVLTKITLKNQVDDLLDKFRAYYQGKLKVSLAELRQPYETLLLKVLSLLQDSDRALASDIIASREAIWGILSDPKKFATL
jgi:hypothetical protein